MIRFVATKWMKTSRSRSSVQTVLRSPMLSPPRWRDSFSTTTTKATTTTTETTAETRETSTTTVPIIYISPSGEEKEVQARVGKNLLDVAHDNNIELEGACGGELACATCHLIFEQETYDTLPEKDDEEDDMLDLAFELTETSRLGCQICVREDMAGMKVRIPDDGFN